MTYWQEDRATVERSQLKDQLMDELYPEFSERVAPQQMEELIAAELARWDRSKVRDFVPMFVRPRVRAQLPPNWGWGSARTLGTLALGVALLAAFVNVERRIARPMLDVTLFRNPRFTAASGSIAIGLFTLAGFTFLITQYFQFVKGYSPFGTGLRLLPVATSIAVAATLGTKLAVRVGNKAIVATGLACFGIALLWIAGNTASTSYLTIAGQMVLGGGGLGLITAPATEAIMGAVPAAKAGVGSAVNDATRLFGAALGVAVIGSIASSLYGSRLDETIPRGLPPGAADAAHGSVGGALVAAQHLARAGLGTTAHHLVDAAFGAFLHSLEGGCRVAGVVALVGAIVAAALLPSRPQAPTRAPADHAIDIEATTPTASLR